MSTYTVQAPSLPTAPRGARWAAAAAASLWKALVTIGHRRAQHELLSRAGAMDAYSPQLAQELRMAARHIESTLAEDLHFGDRLAGR